MEVTVNSLEAMLDFGQRFGSRLKGGEIIELIGDVGTGKTTFVKGIASGLAVQDVVQSPTFTISRVYKGRDELHLCHYDFYRLTEAGIMRDELAEAINDPRVIIALEWDETVHDILPPERTIRIELGYTSEDSREIVLTIPDPLHYIKDAL